MIACYFELNKLCTHTHHASWLSVRPTLMLPLAAVGVCTGVERTMLREGARSMGRLEVRSTCQLAQCHTM